MASPFFGQEKESSLFKCNLLHGFCERMSLMQPLSNIDKYTVVDLSQNVPEPDLRQASCHH